MKMSKMWENALSYILIKKKLEGRKIEEKLYIYFFYFIIYIKKYLKKIKDIFGNCFRKQF